MSPRTRTREPFACTVCMEYSTGLAHYIQEHPICSDCVETEIVAQFDAALEHEHHYPVRFGPIELQASEFEYVLGTEFLESFKRKEIEYKTSPKNRIYCQHKVLSSELPPVGKSASPEDVIALPLTAARGAAHFGDHEIVDCGAMVSGRAQRPGTKLVCYRCNGHTCASCKFPLYDDEEKHDCKPKSSPVADLEAEGQVKGRDFQLCPNPRCGIAINLRDGCNALTCERCYTQFCFLCGKLADHDSNHWQQGSCPRWGTPDGQHQFDPPAREDADLPAPEDADPIGAVIQDMAANLLAVVANHVAEDPDEPTPEAEEWGRQLMNDFRAAHNEAIFRLVMEELRAGELRRGMVERTNAILEEVDRFIVNPNFGPENPAEPPRLHQAEGGWRVPQIQGVPMALTMLRDILQGPIMFDLEEIPRNDLTRMFLHHHLYVREATEFIGDQIMRERLPLLRQLFQDYLEAIPPELVPILGRARL